MREPRPLLLGPFLSPRPVGPSEVIARLCYAGMDSYPETGGTRPKPESDAPPAGPSGANATTNPVLPGLRAYTGRHCNGAEDVRGAIRVLGGADIPACVVGVKALQYYGAGRMSWVG